MEKEQAATVPCIQTPIVNLFETTLPIIDDGFEPYVPPCCGCKYYYTEQEQEGWENPPYTVPCCDRPKGRGENGRPRLFEDGSLEDWMVDYCRHRRVE